MASPYPPASPERQLPPPHALAKAVDIVWGAPSTEMLDAEARGEIILVEDLHLIPHESVSADGQRRRD
jgi:hypothetical protein